MARSKTSHNWLKEHFNDPFVKMAQKDGYRSRASYKLLEIQEKDRLIRPGMSVIDLGAAPGGWSQVTSRLIGGQGRLIASDILEIRTDKAVLFLDLQQFVAGTGTVPIFLRHFDEWVVEV
ncbi:RlmE family RNA methyltransferase, partial [Pseudomonas protegens]|uniref:RlmE family RNA methyltransferase n=1 Tax=Pseudomonas protegens TaxID=380021 RepID=UPI0031F5463A